MCSLGTWILIGDAGKGVIDQLVKSVAESARNRARFQIKPDLPQRAPIARLLAVEAESYHRPHRPQRR